MRLIMLTTRDNHDSNASGVQLFAAILTKPLRRSQLLKPCCVTRAMTQSSESGDDTGALHADWCACHAGRRIRGAPLHVPKILVVEDNPVNREVAVGMLESLGCTTPGGGKPAGWRSRP